MLSAKCWAKDHHFFKQCLSKTRNSLPFCNTILFSNNHFFAPPFFLTRVVTTLVKNKFFHKNFIPNFACFFVLSLFRACPWAIAQVLKADCCFHTEKNLCKLKKENDVKFWFQHTSQVVHPRENGICVHWVSGNEFQLELGIWQRNFDVENTKVTNLVRLSHSH